MASEVKRLTTTKCVCYACVVSIVYMTTNKLGHIGQLQGSHYFYIYNISQDTVLPCIQGLHRMFSYSTILKEIPVFTFKFNLRCKRRTIDYFHCTESSDHHSFRNLTFILTIMSLLRMCITQKGALISIFTELALPILHLRAHDNYSALLSEMETNDLIPFCTILRHGHRPHFAP